MVGVALGLGPLLLPLLLVPTLDELEGRAPRRAWALPLGRAFVRSNLLLSKSNVEAGRWWTRLTYWMLHTSEVHLYSNLISFVPSAIAVNTACGTPFMWATFLAGSAVGSLNIGNLKLKQYENLVKSRMAAPSQLAHSGGLVGAASQAWNHGASRLASAAAPVMSYLSGYAGMSNGCCALLGLDLCLTVEAVHGTLFGSGAGLVAGASEDEAVLRVGSHIMSLYSTAMMVHGDWVAFWDAPSGSPALDHAGHLIGLGFGVGCYVIFKTLERLSAEPETQLKVNRKRR